MPVTNTNTSALILPDPKDAAALSEEAADIRGIKGVVDVPVVNEWIVLLLVLLAVSLVAFISVWIIRRHLAKHSEKSAPPPPPPPHILAWNKLQNALGLIHDANRFCTEVSLIIRVYLEERFDLHAPDRTTEEFLFELQSSKFLVDAHKELLVNFLEECDMVKFAKAEPPENELRRLYEAAGRLIGETQPRFDDGKHDSEVGVSF
ncbi:MAG: hypothetical protein QF731_01095 [Verrucomicrobiota bacterium]|jgi:hypothetical protein|nr:hypothetical protein [Verrucomicrobiota bacterium]